MNDLFEKAGIKAHYLSVREMAAFIKAGGKPIEEKRAESITEEQPCSAVRAADAVEADALQDEARQTALRSARMKRH